MRSAAILAGGTLALWIAGCACAATHEPADAADALDSASLDAGATAMDTGEVGLDIGICDPSLHDCFTDDDCIAWARSIAPPGTFPATRCSARNGNGGICSRGILWCIRVMSGNVECLNCAEPNIACTTSQVCVSDTPGGPTRCATACPGP